MRIYHHYREINATGEAPRIVAIGNFDGVHLGHRRVFETGLARARQTSFNFAVCTFDPHPARFFRPDSPALALTTIAHRLELLEDCGVAEVLAQRFDADFSSLSIADFSRLVLKDALRAALVLVGANFRFGRDRAGTVADLHTLGRDLGFEVESLALLEAGESAISSSRIRTSLQTGDVEGAACLLGRNYELCGPVVTGNGAASKLGFPTVNIATGPVLIPRSGIYAATCILADGQRRAAAAYIGERPTMGLGFSVEAHLLDFKGDLYNSTVRLQFVQRIRDDIHFNDTASVRHQISLDIRAVRERMRPS